MTDIEAPPKSDLIALQGNNKSERPPAIILTSSFSHLSFDKIIKPLFCNQFSVQFSGGEINFVTHRMAVCDVMLSYLTNHSLHCFMFYSKSDKPVKAVIRPLVSNTLSEHITHVLQLLGFDVMSVEQMMPFPCPNF
jgi:hypothetical protein